MNAGATRATGLTGPEAAASRVRDILLVVCTGGLIALSRRYLDLHAGIPGHTGVLWMLALVMGRGLVRRDGAGALMGASAALWGVAVGFNHSLPYNLLMYSLVGLGLDLLVKLAPVDLAHPLGGLVGGALAHAVKFLFLLGYARQFYWAGTWPSLGYHLLFGAAGGVLAGLALWAMLRRARSGRNL